MVKVGNEISTASWNHKVFAVCPAARRASVLASGAQPVGVAPRSVVDPILIRSGRAEASRIKNMGIISEETYHYLVGSTDGTLQRHARLVRYLWLEHRWHAGQPGPVHDIHGLPFNVVRVEVIDVDGHAPLPLPDVDQEEDCEDHEPIAM